MQTTMFDTDKATNLIDRLWRKAAERECRHYAEHFESTEIINGTTVCFNCGGLA